jgi:GNAT superfamily N-acetyltransferase
MSNENKVSLEQMFELGRNAPPLTSHIQDNKTAADAEEQKQGNEQGFGGDAVDAFQSGVGDSAAGMAETVSTLSGSETFGDLAQATNNWSKGQIDQMSPSGQEAMSKQFFQDDENGDTQFGEAWTDPESVGLQISKMAGQLTGQVVTGFGLTGAAAKVGAKVATKALIKSGLRKGMTPDVAAKYAANVIRASAGTTGQALAGAGITGGQMGLQAQEEVMNLSSSELDESEAFREIFHTLSVDQPSYSVGEIRSMARKTLAERVSTAVQTDPAVVITNLTLDAIGGHYIDRIIRGAGSGSRIKNALAQTVAQGGTETIQGGMEQHGINRAMINEEADTNRDPMQGVVTNALNEGVMGGVMGGGMGAAFKGSPVEKPEIQAEEQGVDPQAQEQPAQPEQPKLSLVDAVSQIKAERQQYKGIDDDIYIAESQGFEDEVVRLRAAKRNFEMAEEFANEGDTESAKRFNERALKIYREVTQMGEPDPQSPEPSAQFPAEYIAVGEYIEGIPRAEVTMERDADTFSEMEAARPEVSDFEPDPSRSIPSTVDAPYYMPPTEAAQNAKKVTEQTFTEQQGQSPVVVPDLPEKGDVRFIPAEEITIDQQPTPELPEVVELPPTMDVREGESLNDSDRDAIRNLKMPKGLDDGRLLRTWHRGRLEKMGSEIQYKGGMSTIPLDPMAKNNPDKKYFDFLPSQNPAWFQEAPENVKRISVKGFKRAIDKAVNAKPLKPIEARAVKYALDVITDERNDYARTDAIPEREQITKFRKVMRGELSPQEAGFAESNPVPNRYANRIKRIASSMETRFTEESYSAVDGIDGVGMALADDIKEALDAGLPEPVVTKIAQVFGDDPVEFSLRLFVFTEAHKNGQEVTPTSVESAGAKRALEKETAGREDPGWTRAESKEPEPEEELLSSYTEDDLRKMEAKRQSEEKEKVKAEEKAAKKAKADAEVEGFALSGSGRTADVAASQGQEDLLSAPAEPSQKGNDSFSNYKVVNGEPIEQRFERGEYAKAVKSEKQKTFFKGGVIEGISQSRKEAKINGNWHDFGTIVKAEKPAEYKEPTTKISKVVASANKKTGNGLTDDDRITSPANEYTNGKGVDFNDPELQGIIDRRIEVAKKEILNDVESGTIDPAKVSGWEDLDDFADANMYINDADRGKDKIVGPYGKRHDWRYNEFVDLTNHLVEKVDDWIKSGGLSQSNEKTPANAGVSRSGLPEILTATKTAYLKKMAAKSGLKKSSPGYKDALDKLSEEYETLVDEAQANLSFEEFNQLNSDSPEGVNRQAWKALREEYAIEDAAPEAKPDRPIIRNTAGNPYKSKGAARKALKSHAGYELVEVSGGFELHPIPEGAAVAGNADISNAPRASTIEVNDDFGPDAEPEVEAESDAEPTKPAQLPAHEGINSVMKRLSGGEAVTRAELSDTFEALVTDPDASKSELRKLTKADLEPMTTGHVFSDTKKDRLVNMAYDGLVQKYRFIGNSDVFISWTHGSDIAQMTRDHIDSLTDATIAEYARERKENIDAAIAERKKQIDGLKDPQTLEEFRDAIKLRGFESLSLEQRTQYDRLIAEKAMSDTPIEDVRKGFQSDEPVAMGEPEEGTHGKTGEIIFNVKVIDRLGKDKFKESAAMARSMSGGYWRGNFYFPSIEQANQFKNWMQGEDADLSEKSEERRQQKLERASDRMRDIAERLKSDADENLNADRNTNTLRRADMAAGAVARAETQKTLAKVMAEISEGGHPLLKNANQKVQIELLNSLANRLIYDADPELFESDRMSRRSWASGVTPEQMVQFAQLPMQTYYPDSAKDLAQKMESTKGFKQAANALRAQARSAKDGKPIIIPARVRDKVLEFVTKHGEKHTTHYDVAMNRKRLERMGIKNLPTLRAVLTEFIKLKKSAEGPKRKTKLADLEQALQRTLLGNRKAFNDFFPTPESTAVEIADLANIEDGMKVLEPSAGNGLLADEAKASGADVDTVELAGQLREILKEKGHKLIGDDFLELEPKAEYDRVLMNPPFSKDQDIDHVIHAYKHLKPGGRLVAIVSSMAGDRQNSKNKKFRELLDELGAEEQSLPEGAFKSSLNPTGVNTKVIVIDKPDGQALASLSKDVDEKIKSLSSQIQTGNASGIKRKNTASQVREWLKDMTGGMGSIEIVETSLDLPGKLKLELGTHFNQSEGVYDPKTGKTYIVAGNIIDKHHAKRVFLHEVIGHGGVISYLKANEKAGGKEYLAMLDEIYYRAGQPAIDKEISRYDFNYDNQEERRIAVLEYIAHLAEKGRKMGLVRRMIAALRDLIRRINPDIDWTDTDTLALIERGRRHLKKYGNEGKGAGKPLASVGKGGNAKNIDELRSEIEGVKGIKTISLYESRGKIKLDSIIVDKEYRNSGIGTKALEMIIGYADENSKIVALSPALKDDFQGTTSRSRLIGFYKRFGFIENKGRNKDFEISESMYRKPARGDSALMRLSDDLASDSSLSNDQKEALSKIGPKGPIESAAEKVRGVMDDWRLKVRQGLVDRYAGLMELDKQLLDGNITSEENITRSAWARAKMSNAASGAVSAMMNAGRIFMNGDGIVDVKKDSQGLMYTLNKLGSGAEVERFMGWIAGNRGEKLMAEGRENLFSQKDIDALKSLDGGNLKDGRERSKLYESVFKEFQQYRDDVLAIAEESGVITAENRDMWSNEFYVPFYRLDEDNTDTTGPRVMGGLSRQQAYKKLKGGTQNLNDLLQNTLMNFHHLVDASLKNMAAKQGVDNAVDLGVAEKTSEAARDKKQSTFILRNGEKEWYDIVDPMVYSSLTSLNHTGMNGYAMTAMRWFKRTFTNLTTSTPQFVVANLLRDSMSAVAVTDMSKNAVGNVTQGLKSFGLLDRNGYERARLMATGGAFSFGHVYGEDADSIRYQIDGQMRRAKVIKDPKQLLKLGLKPLKAGWDRWQDVNNSLENVNRAAAFKQSEDAGKGTLYSAFQARDLMDFSAHGAWPAIRFLIDVVPFLNARLQGLDKLYRSGVKPTTKVAAQMLGIGKIEASVNDKKAAARFTAVVGALSAATMALFLHNQDDEDYKKAPDWLKDSYWWFRIPGTDNVITIPKPFEVGAIATITERLLQQAVDDTATGKLFRERISHMLTGTFSFSPVPQMFQPVLDVYANKDSFTGRQIETMGQQRLSKGNRTKEDTTLAARGLSSISTGVFGDDSNYALSPVQMDYLIGGFLGQVGAWGVAIPDMVIGQLAESDKPAKYWTEYQPIRRFYRDAGRPTYTQDSELFYDSIRKADRLYADLKRYREEGDLSSQAEVMEENGDLIGMRKLMNKVNRRLQDIRNRIKAIEKNKDLSGEEKRRRIDLLKLRRNQLIEKVTPKLRAINAT